MVKIPDPLAAVHGAPVRAANRVLGDESWARERLAAHAGRTCTVTIGPLSTGFAIGADGMLSPLPSSSAAADLALTISPFNVPSLLAHPQRWNEFVREDGDAELGGTLKELAQTAPWFVEKAFAGALGPVVGQRVADTGRKLLAFPEYAGQRLTESVASYARDEANLIARGDEMRLFTQRTQEIVDRVDALEARVDAIARGKKPG
jgi:ubiquinone biosynthesis accessory factor UbiJ